MGHQIAIATTPDDLIELLAVASSLGAQATPERIPQDDPPELHDPEELARADHESRLYLLPARLAPVEIFAIEIPDRPGSAKVNVRTSPVVEVIPSRIDDGVLRSGRIFLALSASDSLFRPVKRLYDALKKHTDAWPRTEPIEVRVGPRAAEQIRQHALIVESSIGERLALAEDREP